MSSYLYGMFVGGNLVFGILVWGFGLTLDKLLGDVFDDQLRKELGDFLNSMDEPLKKLAKAATEAEKKHLNNLRGGRPTPREDMGTE